MSGLWMILLLSFLQPDELLPAPKNESLPKPLMVSSNMEPQLPLGTAPECKIGWGTDSEDRSMYLVIQLAPSSIAQFAAGGSSMELESLIPPALRGRIHKVIIRVGNGPVEQSPPESELDRLPPLNASTIPSGSANEPLISNLDMRSPVNIDFPKSAERSSPEIIATSGTQLPVVPGLTLPSTPNPVLPPSNVPAQPSTSYAAQPSTSYAAQPSTSYAAQPSTSYAAQPSTSYAAQPSTSYAAQPSTSNNYATDGFAPMPRSVPSTLNPFGKSGLATTTSTSQGNVTYNSSVPHLATNPNPPNGGYVLPNDSYAGYPQQPQNGYSQGAYGNQGYPATQYAQNTYAGQGITNPVLPIPQVASRPLPSTTAPPTLTSHTLPTFNTERDQAFANASPRGSLVPFFLVLSFILNVYFGLWLNHLSTKYRHLLGSVRGLAPNSLDA
jgi:hypothetical protein